MDSLLILEQELYNATGDETRTPPPYLSLQLCWINQYNHVVRIQNVTIPSDTEFRYSANTNWSRDHVSAHIFALQSESKCTDSTGKIPITNNYVFKELLVFNVTIECHNLDFIGSLISDYNSFLKCIPAAELVGATPVISDSLFAFRDVNQLWAFFYEPHSTSYQINRTEFAESGAYTRRRSHVLSKYTQKVYK